MYTARARFVGTNYVIARALAGPPAIIAAQHEEAHGIIRRSTLYGWLLNRLLPTEGHALDSEDTFAHKAFSRGRTSEEVFATFSSINFAVFAGYSNAVEHELSTSPEYRFYYDIGAALTSAFADPTIKNIVIEGAVRFCWSSAHLLSALGYPLDRVALDALPGSAWPDRRLARLRGDWPQIISEGLVETCLGRPEFAFFRGRSFREIYDPTYGLDVEDRIIQDGDGAFRRQAIKQAEMAGLCWEHAAMFVADHLASRYGESDYTAMSTALSYDWIDKNSQSVRRDRLNLIEGVANLAVPRRVKLHDTIVWDCGWERLIFGIRKTDSFVSNFALPAEADIDDTRRFVLYASRHHLDTSREFDETDVLDIALCPLPPEAPVGTLLGWLPAERTITAVWSSLILLDQDLWRQKIQEIAAADRFPWVVIDSDPYEALAALRPLIEEVRGFRHIPMPSRRGFGGLAVSALPGFGSGLHGLVVMGMVHTLDFVVAMMAEQLGDDFRGLEGPILNHEDRSKWHEGRALVTWLAENELTFDFGGTK